MNWVVMYIDVVKGPKTRISDIVFYGNEEINDRKLRATMKDAGSRHSCASQVPGSRKLLNRITIPFTYSPTCL